MARSILVAHGLGRFGLPTAFSLAQEGYRVLVGLPKLGNSPHKHMVEFALSHDLDLHAVQLDLSDPTSISRTSDLVFSEAGSLDALIYELSVVTPHREPRTDGFNEDASVWHRDGLRKSPEQAAIARLCGQCPGLLICIANPSATGSAPPSSLNTSPDAVSAACFEAMGFAIDGVDRCTILPRQSAQGRAGLVVADTTYIAKLVAELVLMPQGERPRRIFVQSKCQPNAETALLTGRESLACLEGCTTGDQIALWSEQGGLRSPPIERRIRSERRR
jgi:hypothetical protein